jgi:hypothetical protein
MYNSSDKLKKYVMSLVFGMVLVVSSIPNAEALVITRNFDGGAAHANTQGTGSLADIFNVAADYWESIITDAHALTINYSWAALGGSLGDHSLVAQGGVPNRETAAQIRFDNDGSSQFFADSTPLDHSEYTTYTESSADLGGGIMNTGRVYTGATGLAMGSTDLFSVALHEIGHALGLSSANTAFQAENVDLDIDVTSGAWVGAVLPTRNGAHLDMSTSLMWPFSNNGQRTLVSQADWTANCQISQFTECADAASVPEPSIIVLFAAGFLGIGLARRRKQI